jgi:hypothetical protein
MSESSFIRFAISGLAAGWLLDGLPPGQNETEPYFAKYKPGTGRVYIP